jgi:hypothetical protein
MPSKIGQKWPEATVRLLEQERQARVIANFAEDLAEDVRSHPERSREAMSALAEWCKGDLELLAHPHSDVVRHRRRGPPRTVADNRYAIHLYLLDWAAEHAGSRPAA